MKRVSAWMLLIIFFMESPALFAIDSKNAAYFGGTMTTYSGAKDPVEGNSLAVKTSGLIDNSSATGGET